MPFKRLSLFATWLICSAGGMIAFITFVIATIFNPSRDTISSTIAGFGIFITLGNSLFAWARTLTLEESKREADILNKQAVNCIMMAIAFALLTGIKYVMIQSQEGKVQYLNNSWVMFVSYFCLVSCVLFFLVAFRNVIFEIGLVYTNWYQPDKKK